VSKVSGVAQDETPYAAIDHILSTTRSVRKRLDLERPVERSTIEECVRLALQAPTASNGQNWFWSLVDDERSRSQLAAVYGECWVKYRRLQERRRATMSAAQSDALDTLLESGDALTAKMADVPVIVIPCMRPQVSESPTLIELASSFGSVFPAVWSFQLALRSRGLGSVLTTVHLWRADDVAEILNLPPDVTQCGLLPVAYTIGTDFKPARRLPVEAVSAWSAPEAKEPTASQRLS
jgi:nitroreductase